MHFCATNLRECVSVAGAPRECIEYIFVAGVSVVCISVAGVPHDGLRAHQALLFEARGTVGRP